MISILISAALLAQLVGPTVRDEGPDSNRLVVTTAVDWAAGSLLVSTHPKSFEIYGVSGKTIITFNLDSGKIELGPGAKADDAVKRFLNAVESFAAAQRIGCDSK